MRLKKIGRLAAANTIAADAAFTHDSKAAPNGMRIPATEVIAANHAIFRERDQLLIAKPPHTKGPTMLHSKSTGKYQPIPNI